MNLNRLKQQIREAILDAWSLGFDAAARTEIAHIDEPALCESALDDYIEERGSVFKSIAGSNVPKGKRLAWKIVTRMQPYEEQCIFIAVRTSGFLGLLTGGRLLLKGFPVKPGDYQLLTPWQQLRETSMRDESNK